MVYIENEGALFRGPARGLPQEIWDGKQFVPYKDAGKPKDIDWGNLIDEAEAKQLIGESALDAVPHLDRTDQAR